VSGFRGSGFRVQGSGFRDQGSRSRSRDPGSRLWFESRGLARLDNAGFPDDRFRILDQVFREVFRIPEQA